MIQNYRQRRKPKKQQNEKQNAMLKKPAKDDKLIAEEAAVFDAEGAASSKTGVMKTASSSVAVSKSKSGVAPNLIHESVQLLASRACTIPQKGTIVAKTKISSKKINEDCWKLTSPIMEVPKICMQVVNLSLMKDHMPWGFSSSTSRQRRKPSVKALQRQMSQMTMRLTLDLGPLLYRF